MNVLRICAAAFALLAITPSVALAWGEKGHTIINHLAAAGLVGRVPAFLTTQFDVFELSYLGPEMDRIKGAGESWDADFDPGHYVDLLDDGTVAGAVNASAMPESRERYDNALRAVQTDQYRQGYLPYEILDGWQQLRQDFAYWRADDYAATGGTTPQRRARAARDRAVMERVVAQDAGVWGHFVGDASQPLHVTVHFNGWGRFPNPENYTQSRETHSMFESEFVNRYVSESRVAALVKPASSLQAPASLLSQRTVMSAIMSYILASNHTVPQLYAIEKRGGFTDGSAQAVTFAAQRLAFGAAELRDLTVWAWQDSAHASVGYPEVPVSDVVSGKAPWPQGYGE